MAITWVVLRDCHPKKGPGRTQATFFLAWPERPLYFLWPGNFSSVVPKLPKCSFRKGSRTVPRRTVQFQATSPQATFVLAWPERPLYFLWPGNFSSVVPKLPKCSFRKGSYAA